MDNRPAWLSAADGRAAAHRIGRRQDQVVSRRQLSKARVPRWLIRAEVKAGRWQLRGRQVVVLHTGPLVETARWWASVLAAGPRAVLAGVSALQAAGLAGILESTVHVIVPKGSEHRDVPGATVHESRRYRSDDIVGDGVPRTRPAVAAVHAALWARSDRQAQLFPMTAVQQRLVTVAELAEAVDAVRRHPRRRLLRQLVADLAGGVRSLNELDVAQDFRRRGLPEPDRQVVRRRPSGLEYLDCRFTAYRVVLEIDGAGHEDPAQRARDVLRDISVATDGDTTIRLPMGSYRLAREEILARIEALLVVRGWRRAA